MESHAVVLTARWADEKRDPAPPGSGAILIEPHRYHGLGSWSFLESTPSGEARAPSRVWKGWKKEHGPQIETKGWPLCSCSQFKRLELNESHHLRTKTSSL